MSPFGVERIKMMEEEGLYKKKKQRPKAGLSVLLDFDNHCHFVLVGNT